MATTMTTEEKSNRAGLIGVQWAGPWLDRLPNDWLLCVCRRPRGFADYSRHVSLAVLPPGIVLTPQDSGYHQVRALSALAYSHKIANLVCGANVGTADRSRGQNKGVC